MATDEDVLFREVQRFGKWWAWPAAAVAIAGGAGTMTWALIDQLAFGHEFGSNAASDVGLIVIAAFVIPLTLVLGATLLLGGMIIEVRSDAVYFKYAPFHRTFRRTPLGQIERAEAYSFNWFREFAGWGIRMSLRGRGWGYTTGPGGRGVQIVAAGKSRVLGTSRADELVAAIESARRS